MITNMIIEQIQKYDYNQLILVDLLYKNVNGLTECDRRTFNVYIARLAKKGLIERLHRGVYYRAKETKFGKTKPNLYKETVLIHTYGFKGFFGHETLLNLLGLKNEIPKKLTIYTNEIMRNKFVDGRVKLKKIKFNLTHDNIDYIEIITFLNDLNKTEFNNARLYPALAKYMNDKGLQFDKLFDYMVDADEKILKNLILLKKALNYETAQENFMELEKLVSAITHGNQSDPRLIFSNVLQLLQAYFKSDWCILRKLNDFNQNLEIVEYNGLSNDEFDKLKSLTTSSWVYSKIVVKKELIQVNNLSTKSSINNEVYISLGILSFIATPIIVNNKTIGSIKVYNKKPRFWKKSELAFLKIVASQLSLTMSNFDMMNRYRADHRATLNAIIKLLEIKDKYTAGHSHKVAYYSMLIAEELQLSREEIKMIEIAAILHDIGKIVISSRILSKLGKLNEEEFLEMKKHPLIGATVLRSGGFNESICETVEQHHEWWNGKGYPYGISGSNISLYARIVAVADAYDTMTSHRPYHKNKSHSEAIVEIVQCTGTQFCPTAVEAFLSIQLMIER